MHYYICNIEVLLSLNIQYKGHEVSIYNVLIWSYNEVFIKEVDLGLFLFPFEIWLFDNLTRYYVGFLSLEACWAHHVQTSGSSVSMAEGVGSKSQLMPSESTWLLNLGGWGQEGPTPLSWLTMILSWSRCGLFFSLLIKFILVITYNRYKVYMLPTNYVRQHPTSPCLSYFVMGLRL